MADLSKGYTFSGSAPNNEVTATKLNDLVDAATILPAFITGKAEEALLASNDYFVFYDASAAAFKKVSKANLIPSSSTLFKNLAATNNASTPDSKVDVTADEIVLRTSGGDIRLATAFSQTLDITTYTSSAPTANGRDFASEAASTWYYVWAISDGTNDRLLLSSSSSAPSMPSGYTFKALIGAVYNDSSSNFKRFRQKGRSVAVTTLVGGATTHAGNPKTNSFDFTSFPVTTAGTFQAVDLSANIPPDITASVQGILGQTSTNSRRMAVATLGTGNMSSLTDRIGVQLLFSINHGTALDGFNGGVNFSVPVSVSQTIYWTADETGADKSMRITGFELNL